MSNVVGVAIGMHVHTILVWNADGGCDEEKIQNSRAGLERLVVVASGSRVIVMAGNRRWGMPMAYSLRDAGVENIRYIPRRVEKADGTSRSRNESVKMSLRHCLEAGNMGRLMLEGKRLPRADTTHGWYATAMEYVGRVQERRRAKHHLRSGISVLFPETLRPSSFELKKFPVDPAGLPPDIWTKKMTPVLECPDPFVLDGRDDIPGIVRALAKESIGRAVPADERKHGMELHAENLTVYREAVAQCDAALERLRTVIGDHPIVRHFEGSDSALVLTAFVGWRKWPWRLLRSFAGLSVTRVDSKGRPRISRVRGEIRQYLYILKSTTIGKDLAALPAETMERLKTEKKRSRRVKELERLLKNVWKMYLR